MSTCDSPNQNTRPAQERDRVRRRLGAPELRRVNVDAAPFFEWRGRKKSMLMHTITKPIMVLTLIAGATQAGTTTTTFSDGSEGWSGPSGPGGATNVLPSGGNDGAYLQTDFSDFGITFRNNTNEAFIGDYTTADEITISMDLLVRDISGFAGQSQRTWLVELRDFDSGTNGLPWASAFFVFDTISVANNSNWTNYSVTFDPNSSELPSGWGGYGAEDPNTFEPILPPGIGFNDVLSGVDEIAFTTLEPGFFYLSEHFTVGVDNLSITRTVPAPSALAMLALSGLVGTRRER